jgi:hypothetical protein
MVNNSNSSKVATEPRSGDQNLFCAYERLNYPFVVRSFFPVVGLRVDQSLYRADFLVSMLDSRAMVRVFIVFKQIDCIVNTGSIRN